MLSEVPGVYMPEKIIRRMEAAHITGNAQEEGVQIALELITYIKKYHGQGIHGIHLMPVGWDEIVPRLVMEAGLMSKEFLQNYAFNDAVATEDGGLSKSR